MPTVAWQSFKSVERQDEYLALAGVVPLKSFRQMPAFLRMSNAIRDQLTASAGLVGYSLRVHFLSRLFWTLSVWESEQVLQDFVARAPHVEAMVLLRPHIGKPTFVTWNIPAAAVPPAWGEALERLRAASQQ